MSHHRPARPLVGSWLAALACTAACLDPGASGEQCTAERVAPKVYNGTLAPSQVPLTPGQILAIGMFQNCSGTLIAPSWVFTAAHCGLFPGIRFCMGEKPDEPDRCIRSSTIINHPDADIALVELTESALLQAPEVEPIAIMTDPMGQEWLGRQAEAAGYGQTETAEVGTRYFVAEPIVAVQGDALTVDGQGLRGVCFGDSGGPSLVIANDGTVRVAGALSNGEDSCVGRDNFTRTDVYKDWIESFTGPTPIMGASCGSIGSQGRCQAGRAIWCGTDSTLTVETCAPGTACGWDDGTGGFRCIAGPDSCQGYDGFGGCDGNVAYWCENGELRSRDCSACDGVCEPAAGSAGADCISDGCKGLDYLGRCTGNVAEWCENGQLTSRDCSAFGQTCGYIDDTLGYYCR